MSLHGRMDKENVVHLYNGYTYTMEYYSDMSFAGKWIELENSILSEVTQRTEVMQRSEVIKRETLGMYSLVSDH